MALSWKIVLYKEERSSGLHTVWVTRCSHSTALHHPGEACGRAATLALRCVLGSTAGVRWGMVVRWAPHWAKPRSHSVALGIAAGQKTDCEPWLSTSAPETSPSARGPGGASLPSQTSCRAPDVDLSGPAEAENTAKTQSEPSWALGHLSHALSRVLSVMCNQWGLDKQTSCWCSFGNLKEIKSLKSCISM